MSRNGSGSSCGSMACMTHSPQDCYAPILGVTTVGRFRASDRTLPPRHILRLVVGLPLPQASGFPRRPCELLLADAQPVLDAGATLGRFARRLVSLEPLVRRCDGFASASRSSRCRSSASTSHE